MTRPLQFFTKFRQKQHVWKLCKASCPDTRLHGRQGDQMRLWKCRPIWSPTNYFSKLIHNWYRWKKHPKNLNYYCNFQNTSQSKELPNRRKFAQSGHPDGWLHTLIPHTYKSSYPGENTWINIKNLIRKTWCDKQAHDFQALTIPYTIQAKVPLHTLHVLEVLSPKVPYHLLT
jgi:hypothetical protein